MATVFEEHRLEGIMYTLGIGDDGEKTIMVGRDDVIQYIRELVPAGIGLGKTVSIVISITAEEG